MPDGAVSGCVTLGRRASGSQSAAQKGELDSLASFEGCLGHFGIGRPGLGAVMLDPAGFCRLTVCPPGSPNFVRVQHKPVIVSFVAKDANGREIGTDGVEAGTPLTVSWNVTSDADAPRVSISGVRPLHGLSPSGYLMLSPQDMRSGRSVMLTAKNLCGSVTSKLTIKVFRKLYLDPVFLSFPTNGMGTLTIRSSCPVVSDVLVTLDAFNLGPSNNPPRVNISPEVMIPAGSDAATVTVSPSLGGDENAYIASLTFGQPAAAIRARASNHSFARVDVWVEPPLGQAIKLPGLDIVGVVVPLSGQRVAVDRNQVRPVLAQRAAEPHVVAIDLDIAQMARLPQRGEALAVQLELDGTVHNEFECPEPDLR